MCHHLNVSMDGDYYKALLNGTWPQSKPIHDAFLKWKEERLKEIS